MNSTRIDFTRCRVSARAATCSAVSERLKAALALAVAGFSVFPVYEVVDNRCACGRRACQSAGKHPRTKNGHHSGTRDPEQLRMWCRSWPRTNLAVRTGGGLLVLDIDPRNGGERSLKALIEAHGPLPETPTVSTGGGGIHYLFEVEGTISGKTGVWPGVDVKADGGYVVVPPSVHVSGGAYAWSPGSGIGDLPRARAPQWLLEALCGKTSASPIAGAVVSGARNNHLMSVAGRLRRQGSDEAAIHSVIQLQNQTTCRPPLGGDEVRRIAASASRYAKGGVSGVAEVLDASGASNLGPQSSLAERESAVARLKGAAVELDLVSRALLRDELVQRRGFSAALADAVLRQTAAPEAGAQGAAVLFKAVAPWPEPVGAGLVLDEVLSAIQAYVVLPSHCGVAIALWIMHTHAFDAAQITPRLAIVSPEKRCGKSTVLKLLSALVRRPLEAANITTAVLFRSIESHGPTLLVDEADTFLRERDDLRGVLNAGHDRQSAKVLRCVGDDSEPRVFGVWAAVAFASIGKQHDTLMDRSIVVSMKRRREASEPIAKFRRRERDKLVDLSRRLVRCAADNAATLSDLQVEPPTGLSDRAADNWEALLAIAQLAGGAWPELAKAAALALSGADRRDEPDTHGELILKDIREIFARSGARDLPAKELLEELVAMEERPWPEANRGDPMTARQLGARLGRFEICSRTVRHGSAFARSYVRADFDDAFARYLAPLSVTAVTNMNLAGGSTNAPSLNPDVTVVRNGKSSAQFKDVTNVTDAQEGCLTNERAETQRFET
jgi:Protein of unknown function (DUF3631)/Bifunctional DNA primase/polymerase, N-terminal/Primase C terminal 1 (PriCT-1)